MLMPVGFSHFGVSCILRGRCGRCSCGQRTKCAQTSLITCINTRCVSSDLVVFQEAAIPMACSRPQFYYPLLRVRCPSPAAFVACVRAHVPSHRTRTHRWKICHSRHCSMPKSCSRCSQFCFVSQPNVRALGSLRRRLHSSCFLARFACKFLDGCAIPGGFCFGATSWRALG